MKCPDCGREAPEGYMYCDRCGREFQMVPEFEPEIETQIDNILSGLASKIDGGLSNDKPAHANTDFSDADRMTSDTKEIKIQRRRAASSSDLHNGTVPNKKAVRNSARKQSSGHTRTGRKRKVSAYKKKVLISIPVLVLFVLILVVTISIAHKTSADYIRMAVKAHDKGDTAQALEYLLKAEEEAPQDAEAYLLRAKYFREGGDLENAAAELVQITNSAAFPEEDLKKAFVALADIYYVNGNYDALYMMVDRCPFPEVKEQYAKELLPAPVLSPEAGEYEGRVEIIITAPEGATAVYYTLDGSNPDESKLLYTEPIVILEAGDVTVRAVAVSDKGLLGNEGTAFYDIKPVKVKAPQVLQASGNYSKATKIVVMAEPGLTIHYTTEEKKMPDEKSPVYEEPIEMPTGETFYNFVCIDEKGNKSEVINRQYILNIERRITEQNAVIYVQKELQNKGSLEPSLVFQVEGTVEIGNEGEFYFIREYKNGVPTGLLYAVNTQNGLTKRLGYDTGGRMVLMAF